ncbi:hypothetical protein FACS189465_1790 [Clostridia bacterium]|nr:hypothetical protein FACS189465_1790 [Clostridia bacterium]
MVITDNELIVVKRITRGVDIVMECVDDGTSLKHYAYNPVTCNEATTLDLCIQLVKGGIALSKSGICSLDLTHTNNTLVDKNGTLKYIDYEDRRIGTPEEAAKSNFSGVKKMVFGILKNNFSKTLYKKLLNKMGYILKVKEERHSPRFYYLGAEGVLYNPVDVFEVDSDKNNLNGLLTALNELQEEQNVKVPP